jgi:hypothetical protein
MLFKTFIIALSALTIAAQDTTTLTSAPTQSTLPAATDSLDSCLSTCGDSASLAASCSSGYVSHFKKMYCGGSKVLILGWICLARVQTRFTRLSDCPVFRTVGRERWRLVRLRKRPSVGSVSMFLPLYFWPLLLKGLFFFSYHHHWNIGSGNGDGDGDGGSKEEELGRRSVRVHWAAHGFRWCRTRRTRRQVCCVNRYGLRLRTVPSLGE